MIKSSTKPGLIKKGTFGIFAAILAIILVEVALRLAGAFTEPVYLSGFVLDQRKNTALYMPDNYLFWKPVAGPETGFTSANTRGAVPENPKRSYRILCLGDSITWGFRQKPEDSYPARLGRKLKGRAEVLNAGVCGYTIVQGYRFFERYLPGIEPDLVIAAFGTNDVYEAEKEDIEYPRLSPLVWKTGRSLSELRITRMLAGLMPAGEMKKSRVSPETFAQYAKMLDALAEKRGAKVIFALCPMYVSDESKLRLPLYKYGKERKTINFKDAFSDVPWESMGDFFIDNRHYSPAGAEKVAGFIREVLLEKGYLANDPNEEDSNE